MLKGDLHLVLHPQGLVHDLTQVPILAVLLLVLALVLVLVLVLAPFRLLRLVLAVLALAAPALLSVKVLLSRQSEAVLHHHRLKRLLRLEKL